MAFGNLRIYIVIGVWAAVHTLHIIADSVFGGGEALNFANPGSLKPPFLQFEYLVAGPAEEDVKVLLAEFPLFDYAKKGNRHTAALVHFDHFGE
jgi:hypothetical protein